jgi:AbrB family looped-hinge helix DNA binding protein
MDIGITHMSSKGQIVIPASMRKDLAEGEKILVIKDGDRFILKPLADLEPALQEDLLFAERTESALLEYEKGNCIHKSDREFLHDLSSW